MHLDQYEVIIFDSDGVLVEEGTAMEGASELTSQLIKLGKKVIVFSNNSTTHPKKMKINYQKEGIEVTEVINSALLVAQYCINNSINSIYVIGELGFQEVLQEHGLTIMDHDVEAVLVGMDRTLTYEKLAIATRLIRNGAKFIASNSDKSFPTPRGLEPGAGSMIAALTAATDKEPDIVLGKPNLYGFEFIISKYTYDLEKYIMIGDRYETDMLGALNSNIEALIVNTGVASTREDPGKYLEYPRVRVIESLLDLII